MNLTLESALLANAATIGWAVILALLVGGNAGLWAWSWMKQRGRLWAEMDDLQLQRLELMSVATYRHPDENHYDPEVDSGSGVYSPNFYPGYHYAFYAGLFGWGYFDSVTHRFVRVKLHSVTDGRGRRLTDEEQRAMVAERILRFHIANSHLHIRFPV